MIEGTECLSGLSRSSKLSEPMNVRRIQEYDAFFATVKARARARALLTRYP